MNDLNAKIIATKQRLQELETEHTEAGFNLRTLRDAVLSERKHLYELIDQMAGTSYTLPGFDRGVSNGTPDEHQRGPTVFPDMESPDDGKKGRPARKRAAL